MTGLAFVWGWALAAMAGVRVNSPRIMVTRAVFMTDGAACGPDRCAGAW